MMTDWILLAFFAFVPTTDRDTRLALFPSSWGLTSACAYSRRNKVPVYAVEIKWGIDKCAWSNPQSLTSIADYRLDQIACDPPISIR